MSNVVVTVDQTGLQRRDGTTLYELDEAIGVKARYYGAPYERTAFESQPDTAYCVYGTDNDDSPLTVVSHMKESPYGSGLYFNAYARNIGDQDPVVEHVVSYNKRYNITTVINRVTSGHFEQFFPGEYGCRSVYVGPRTTFYWADFSSEIPKAHVSVSTVFRGNLLTGTATRKNFPHLSYNEVKSGDLEGFLQEERMAAEIELDSLIARTISDGIFHTKATIKFAQPKFNFKLNEYEDFSYIRDLDVIPTKLRWIAGNAYINACQNLPKTANNTLQNVIEVINAIRSIKSGNLGKAAKSFLSSSAYEGAKSAWLMYRYQYNTTKMDFEEYKDLTYRLKNLQQIPKITIHGDFAWGGYQCRCSFDVNACDFIPHTLKEFLRAYGLYFKTADIWDDIPFSFIVDWFLHLGDVFTWLDAHEDAWNVRPSNVWYSWETSYDGQTCYIRASGEPIVNAPYLATNTSSSTKVKAMRFADVISIFL